MNDVEEVARRIVMPRAVWDQLVAAAEAASPTIKSTPVELAALAIERGVERILRGQDRRPT